MIKVMEIKNVIDLKAAIAALEQKRVIQEAILKKEYHDIIEHYKPKNLIKSAFKNVLEPGETGSTLLKAAGSLGAGLLAKNLMFGGPATSVVGKIAGNAIKLGATSGIFNNSDKIVAWSKSIYKNLFTKDHSHNNNLHHQNGKS